MRLRVVDVDPIGRAHLDAYETLQREAGAVLRRDVEAQHRLRLAVVADHPVLVDVAVDQVALRPEAHEAHLCDGVFVDEPLVAIEAEGRRLRLAAEGGA